MSGIAASWGNNPPPKRYLFKADSVISGLLPGVWLRRCQTPKWAEAVSKARCLAPAEPDTWAIPLHNAVFRLKGVPWGSDSAGARHRKHQIPDTQVQGLPHIAHTIWRPCHATTRMRQTAAL